MTACLIMAALLLGLSGCPGAARREGPPPATPSPPAPSPQQPPATVPGPGGLEPDQSRSGHTPDLAGGPEEGSRPHYDPPRPPEYAYLRGDRSYRTVALTFDDGPDLVYTPRVLDVLKQHGVPATFFLVGNRAKAHPQVVKRILAEGHELGNHSWDHAYLPKLTQDRLDSNLRSAEQTVRSITGKPMKYFRPPYGSTNQTIAAASKNLGYKMVLWNVDSLDWKQISHEEVAKNVLPNVRNGSIVLFHSAGGPRQDLTNTVEALPLIIRTLRGQGYRFVTISEMLATGQPRPGVW